MLAGRYRLISELRVGGMGITYRAWDLVNEVPVVVKMPKRQVRSDEEAMHRFAREIDAMLALPHDHIVPITDHGEENGCPYVVMRFLPGGSLADHRRRDESGNPLANPAGMLHFWLPAVAEALDYIHQKGVLHRDVKPDNIYFDGFWNAFLGDFGIAKVVDTSAGLAKEQTLTAIMIAIGTPEYMAPELFGFTGKPDGRADQYALAVTVYEMLCGTKPFTGAKNEIFREHSVMPAPPLHNRGLGIPMSLCVAVERALAKTPPERFGTCTDFARAALRDVLPLVSEPDTARLMCPSRSCATILKMPTSSGGQWGKCPKCKVSMRVASDFSALWLRNEELGGGDAGVDGPVVGDIKEATEKPAGLSSTFPAIDKWAVPQTRHVPRQIGSIPTWASFALFVSLFLVGATMYVGVAEIQSLRQRNKELQIKVESLDAEVTRLKSVPQKTGVPEEPVNAPLKTVPERVDMELVEIPAGEFQMGEGDGAVKVKVTRSFWMGKTEVTRGQWENVMPTKPWRNARNVPDDKLPAVNVIWDDATEFCRTLTERERGARRLLAGEEYRLPTEAEWEYACRAGTNTAFSFGNAPADLDKFAWFVGNARSVRPVGDMKENPWGLRDMHGNVWEWCSDWFDDTLKGGDDPTGPDTGKLRVRRGGSVNNTSDSCKSAHRNSLDPSSCVGNMGFRVVLTKLDPL